MSRVNLRTLVLNNNYLPVSVTPLYTISAQDAIVRHLNNTGDVVVWYDRKILTPSRNDLYWPSVIVNRTSKNIKKSEVKLKKLTLYYRDHGECSYCGSELTLNNLTYEHVIPKSKGGEHSWNNVVAGCKHCNTLKGNADPVGKWKPKKEPYTPSYFDILEIRKKFPIIVDDMKWKDFLPSWSGEVVLKER